MATESSSDGGRHAPLVLPVTALAIGLAVWWAATTLLTVPEFLVPSPAAVVARLGSHPELYARNAWFTLEKILVGGALGIASGFTVALAITYVSWLRRALYPYLVTVRVLPKLAIAPVLLLYFGIGFSTAVIFVALVAFFPMVVSATAGLSRVPDAYLDLLASVDAPASRALLAVRLPYALPDLFGGLKQSVTLAVIGAVVAEWIVADNGLGFLILFASENVQADVMVAALLILFVEGLALYGAVVLLQRLLLWETP